MRTVLAVGALLLLASPVFAADPDTPSANEAVIKTQLDEMNRGDWKTALGLYTPDTRNFGRKVGTPVMAQIFADIDRTFPDFQQKIVDIVAVGDSVIVREKMSGTHDGTGRLPVNGGMLVGVPPTHKHYLIDAIRWYMLKDGKILDHDAVRDDLAMMQQLGLSPQPRPFDWGKFASAANGHAAGGAASAP